jgi:hypothetical protein
MSPHPEPDRIVRVDVTLIVPRRVGWLLAGIAVGNLGMLDGLLDKVILVLRAVLPG